jgi:hypothetical protein
MRPLILSARPDPRQATKLLRVDLIVAKRLSIANNVSFERQGSFERRPRILSALMIDCKHRLFSARGAFATGKRERKR